MAEQPQRNDDRKARLIAELERSRAGLARDMRGVRHHLDVGAHLKRAILRQKTAWLAGAAVTGWLVTRLPGRKKKAKAAETAAATEARQAKSFFARFMPQPKQTERSGWLLAVLGLLGTLVKPMLTSYLTQKVSDLASRHQQPAPPRRPPRY